MTPPAAIVFDLDGTLIDTRRDLAEAVNRVRASYGLGALPVPAVVAMVGAGARNLVARALGLERQLGGEPPAAGEIALSEAHQRFLAAYDRVLLATTRAYPGIPELLARLAALVPVGVLTNKPERSTRRLLDGLDLARHVAAVVGGDTVAALKPDPAGLHHLLERLGVAAAAAVLVGDSAIDAATAAAAGCPFVLAGWGFASDRERAGIAERHRPACVAADAGELGRFLLGG